jgi:hypothetical protein
MKTKVYEDKIRGYSLSHSKSRVMKQKLQMGLKCNMSGTKEWRIYYFVTKSW